MPNCQATVTRPNTVQPDPSDHPAVEQRTLADIMSEVLHTVAPNLTLADAARHMNEAHVSSLIVLDDGLPVGILTERDMLRHLALGHASHRACERCHERARGHGAARHTFCRGLGPDERPQPAAPRGGGGVRDRHGGWSAKATFAATWTPVCSLNWAS